MENIIIIAVLLAITAGVIFYLRYRKKKCGACATCPHACNCKAAGGEAASGR